MTPRHAAPSPNSGRVADELGRLRAQALANIAAGVPLWPVEVGALYRADPRAVQRWANDHLIESFRTPGGHRRYPAAQFVKFLEEEAA